MSTQPADETDTRIIAAIEELRTIVAEVLPTAVFEISHGDDPDGTYLTAYVNEVDVLPVADLVMDRLLEFQIDDGLPVYFLPVHSSGPA